ncbi:MAG: glutamate--tRNA ligase [Gammaproteobacteria bacterium]|nr:glutamate--tRNA ligase [Gammaproteobacteria bacterium]
MSVRTRVAPSPTGDPHVGTAYMALFNYAFARRHGGRFVLRIEDTDRARSSAASEEAIFEALHWLGLDWDEGPDVGGPSGPYRQSERREAYTQHVEALLESGKAFYCFCSRERLDAVRREQQEAGQTPRYDGHCLSVDPDEARARVAAGEEHVIRLAVPGEGTCQVEDGLRGTIEIPWQQVDMQVLVKADGFPTYHLAVVVDDHLMAISHVLRGEEWINSMPKHRLLYDGFGWDMPQHYHLPLLRNPDRSKLSKRKNPTGIDYYRRRGYLPEALLNYLALMGWSMPDEREVFSLAEMIENFDIDRVSVRGPVFDPEKLDWLSGQHLRALEPQDFAARFNEWASADRLASLIPLVRERTERFSDLAGHVDFLMGDRAPLDTDSFASTKRPPEECRRILDHVLRAVEPVESWQRDALHEAISSLATAMSLKLRDLMPTLFIAIAGRSRALPLFDSMAWLGRDLTRDRLRTAIAALGGISKKEAKRLERAWRDLW